MFICVCKLLLQPIHVCISLYCIILILTFGASIDSARLVYGLD